MKSGYYLQSGEKLAATKSQKRLTCFGKNLGVFIPKMQGDQLDHTFKSKDTCCVFSRVARLQECAVL